MSILTDGGGHIGVNVLVAHEKPLSYNLQIGIDAIQALGGVTITLARDGKLGEGKEACLALCIDELDFDASFDHNERIWTTRWKWTLNNAPTLLCNLVAECKIPNNIRGTANVDYEWLIPYPKE